MIGVGCSCGTSVLAISLIGVSMGTKYALSELDCEHPKATKGKNISIRMLFEMLKVLDIGFAMLVSRNA